MRIRLASMYYDDELRAGAPASLLLYYFDVAGPIGLARPTLGQMAVELRFSFTAHSHRQGQARQVSCACYHNVALQDASPHMPGLLWSGLHCYISKLFERAV